MRLLFGRNDRLSTRKGAAQEQSRASGSHAHHLQDTIGNRGVLSALGAGQPLPSEVRASFEPELGDLSEVRVHTDSAAADSAQRIDARAYAFGNDIVFGAGEYAPGTIEGQALIEHELTHVAEQRSGLAPVRVERQPRGTELDVPSKILLLYQDKEDMIEEFRGVKSAFENAEKTGADIKPFQIDFDELHARSSMIMDDLDELVKKGPPSTIGPNLGPTRSISTSEMLSEIARDTTRVHRYSETASKRLRSLGSGPGGGGIRRSRPYQRTPGRSYKPSGALRTLARVGVSAGASIGASLFNSWMKDRIREEVKNLPPPKIDRRTANEFLTDPNTTRTLIFFDAVYKELRPFQEQVESEHFDIGIAAIFDAGAIELDDDLTHDQKSREYQQIEDRLLAHMDRLKIVQENIRAVLELDADRIASSADQLLAVLDTWPAFAIAFYIGGYWPEEYLEILDALERFSNTVHATAAEYALLERRVDAMWHDAFAVFSDINDRYWTERYFVIRETVYGAAVP